MHVIAAKAVALGEALKPEFRTYQKQVMENAKTMAAVLTKGGRRVGQGGSTTRRGDAPAGEARGAPPGARAHHGQQERDPQRSAEADGDERRAHRLAGDDHPPRPGERGRGARPTHTP